MRILEDYHAQNPGSLRAWEEASKYLPSGNTRSALFWQPFPLCLRRGEGSHNWDVDGNERIDFNFNNTSLIMGHNHPKVVEAAKAQWEKGTVLGAPTETEPKLAEEITSRLGGADRVRFTPSGTEANMQAVRVARAYSRRPLLAKCLGAYHGSWDAVPLTPGSVGIPQAVKDCTVYFPYNDAEAAEETIKKHRDKLAAVIVEPTMRDMTPKPGFLQAVREAAEDNDVLLIFDEVISFRLSHGGAQTLYGVTPDMTTMGKIIGGGFPVGAYAATEEVMSPLSIPAVELPETASPMLSFSGTFNAHPLAMTAGLTVMKEMKPSVYEEMAKMGDEMRNGLKDALAGEGVEAHVGGVGSLFSVAWTDREVMDHETSRTADRALFNVFNLGMMNRGVFILGHPNVSAVQTEEDLKKALMAAEETVAEMKPLIRERTPHLLR
jgi:glutamate-1-semialdehyde 2,1-aminomutase